MVQFPFGITEGSQFSAEHAPGIYVDRAVQPFRLGNRRMPINHHRLATILSCPVVTHWESVFIRLPGGLSIERKIAHLRRAATLHRLLHAGVRYNKLAVVENVVTH